MIPLWTRCLHDVGGRPCGLVMTREQGALFAKEARFDCPDGHWEVIVDDD